MTKRITDLQAEGQIEEALGLGDLRLRPDASDDWRAPEDPAHIYGEAFRTVASSVTRYPEGPQRARALEGAAQEMNERWGIPIDEAKVRIERGIEQNTQTESFTGGVEALLRRR